MLPFLRGKRSALCWMCCRLIGFDDLLHQTMAHDIFFCKITLRNAAHAFQHLQRVHKAAAGPVRQVDLSYIAGDVKETQ